MLNITHVILIPLSFYQIRLKILIMTKFSIFYHSITVTPIQELITHFIHETKIDENF